MDAEMGEAMKNLNGSVAPALRDSEQGAGSVSSERPEKCPTCASPAPHFHPTLHEGEVQECPDAWHWGYCHCCGKPINENDPLADHVR